MEPIKFPQLRYKERREKIMKFYNLPSLPEVFKYLYLTRQLSASDVMYKILADTGQKISLNYINNNLNYLGILRNRKEATKIKMANNKVDYKKVGLQVALATYKRIPSFSKRMQIAMRKKFQCDNCHLKTNTNKLYLINDDHPSGKYHDDNITYLCDFCDLCNERSTNPKTPIPEAEKMFTEAQVKESLK